MSDVSPLEVMIQKQPDYVWCHELVTHGAQYDKDVIVVGETHVVVQDQRLPQSILAALHGENGSVVIPAHVGRNTGFFVHFRDVHLMSAEEPEQRRRGSIEIEMYQRALTDDTPDFA